MADDWGETAVEEAPSVEVKLFGRWNPDDVQINDISLAVSNSLIFNSDLCEFCGFILIIAHRYILLGLYSSKRKSFCISTSYGWSLCC